RELLAIEVIPAGKSLEGDVAVPVKFVAHDIEIIVAAGNGKIAAPPVLDPFELDEAIDLELSDLVRAGAKRSIERRFFERPRGVIGLREDRQAWDIKRDVAVPL